MTRLEALALVELQCRTATVRQSVWLEALRLLHAKIDLTGLEIVDRYTVNSPPCRTVPAAQVGDEVWVVRPSRPAA